MGSSKDGVATIKWGRYMWIILDYNAEHLTNDLIRFKKILCLLTFVMPCKHCRNSTKIFLPYILKLLNTTKDLKYIIYFLHDLVNIKLNKPRNLISLKEYRNKTISISEYKKAKRKMFYFIPNDNIHKAKFFELIS